MKSLAIALMFLLPFSTQVVEPIYVGGNNIVNLSLD